MMTIAEIDGDGRVIRIFHRTPTASWTHAPGERYRYRGGRHGEGWVTMQCACAVPKPARVRGDQKRVASAGRSPGGAAMGSTRSEEAVA